MHRASPTNGSGPLDFGRQLNLDSNSLETLRESASSPVNEPYFPDHSGVKRLTCAEATDILPPPKHREPRKVLIVLPTYNEEACLGRLLQAIDETLVEARLSYHVIVVDDGSVDATPNIVKDYSQHIPITLKRHSRNEGLGGTIRDGLYAAAALAGERDIILTMDADDTHVPGLILGMTRMISEGHDVVIASRYRPGARTIGVPMMRRFVSYVSSLLFRILFPTSGVRDFTCGYRAYRASVLQQAIQHYDQEFLDQEGFECMVDILLKLRRMNIIFGEVPIILRYDRKQGLSKMKIARTIWNTLRLIARRRFSG